MLALPNFGEENCRAAVLEAPLGCTADPGPFARPHHPQLAGAEMQVATYEACQPGFDGGSLDEEEGAARADKPSHSLFLDEMQHLDSLRALLDALLSPRTPLHSLCIHAAAPLAPAAVLGCGEHLASLTALDLSARQLPASSQLAVLQALLEQAPHVTALGVGLRGLGGPLPAFVAQRPWRQLRLTSNGFTELPAQGVYLSGEPSCIAAVARPHRSPILA